MGSKLSAPARKHGHGAKTTQATTDTTAAAAPATPATTEAAASTPATAAQDARDQVRASPVMTPETASATAQDAGDKVRASPVTTAAETPATAAQPVEVQPPSSSAYRDPIYVYGVPGAGPRAVYTQPSQPVIVQQPVSMYVVQDYFTCRFCGHAGPARIVNLGPSALA
jgi:hypothetical protein